MEILQLNHYLCGLLNEKIGITMILKLPDGRTSSILIGENIENLSDYLDSAKVFILTNPSISDLYADVFPKNATVITMPAGEQHKTLDTVLRTVRQLIAGGADRKSVIVGFGGGIVCDMTGFIASIYMRGVKFGFVPTTLMAQVDASVGGKNGVNCDGYKNMIGVFNQPDFVLCDPKTLKSLPARELKAGMAEVIKSGLIADAALFSYVEDNVDAILNCEKKRIDFIVENSLKIKALIVEADEKESGERKKLNLGHTFGHAVEKHSKNVLHGEAVSIGLVIAAKISELLNLITNEEFMRIKNILTKTGLPVSTDITAANLLEAIGKDKKRESGFVHFVLNKGIGNSEIREIACENLAALLDKALKAL
ncbi:MAG: 3-dehydroquinate synthase [Prevotellaceae bacterium]|jgi:3-dehydroquinate synthase|nr:3-dehydroquinate synthase [Prevotellaceae bacterium]